jgi:ribosomal protein S18 acetylase RimI-like enzyme
MSFELVFKKWSSERISLEYAFVPWDTDIFGFNFYDLRLPPFAPGLSDSLVGLVQKLTSESSGKCLLFTRVGADDIPTIQTLTRSGFYPVETMVEPSRDLRSFELVRDFSSLALRPAERRDAGRLLELSQTAFGADRYHLDPNLSKECADERYRSWVRSSLESDDLALVFEKAADQTVLGFVVLREAENNNIDISLAAIDSKHQDAGLGVIMYGKCLAECRSRGYKRAVTRISLNNVRVLNIYAHYGFMFRRPRVTLHYCSTSPATGD